MISPKQWTVLILTATLLALPGWYVPVAAYTPQYDQEETENISVYERASRATVTINALVNGHPSSGTGVSIDPSGIILTSGHVIGDATTVYVSLEDGRKGRAAVIGRTGNKSDLALLKVNFDTPLPYLSLADSDKVKVGQKVLSIGNPFGFERSLSTGIVSRIDAERDRIQTDAAINPGCSGGPLLDTRGNVIGINVAIFNPNRQGAYVDRTNIGIGFAVPVNTVKDFLRELASERAIPATVAAISKKPVVRYIPPGRGNGYENVSVILQRVTNQY